MIVHDLATLGPDLIRNAIISAAAITGLGAALLVLGIALITAAVTGNVPVPRRRSKQDAAEYGPAA
ncbi:hypothetical protein ACVHNB_32730 [Streptomyces sp. YJ-C3]